MSQILNWGLPTFEAGEALDKHDLVYVSAAGVVSKTSASSDLAVGTVLQAYAVGDKEVSVVPLGKGTSMKMRASGIIAVGKAIIAAADGECAEDAVPAAGVRVLGVALSAAAAANDVIEVFTY